MRKKIVAGNWKMNKNASDAEALISELLAYQKKSDTNTEVWVAPPFIYTQKISEIVGNENIGVFAQDVSANKNGAFTGEISAEMLKDIGLKGTIIGHSERRQYHAESNKICNKKINAALSQNLIPIYCIGETLEQRKENRHFTVVEEQLKEGLKNLADTDAQKIVLAYEPVWAIGTGETATPQQAQEIHAHLRKVLLELYGEEISAEISILYGGSVKPENAKEIFLQKDIDGGLIGGASLESKDFTKVIESL